jgi:outer membrane receptor protein involved in Fe transport
MNSSRRLLAALAAGTSIVAFAAPAQAQTHDFNIPPGRLKAALDAFARQSGRQVIYRVDDIRSAQSPGARGLSTDDQALTALLAGTGFEAHADRSGAIAIVGRSGTASRPLDPAESGAALPASAGPAEAAITITGSRIRAPNLRSVVPITSVSGQEFFQTGKVAIGESLNELPALRSTVTQTNSFSMAGAVGANMLDLRGLGIDRTLVLQNGRRHISGWPYTTAADVNTIPTDLIDRVDIVTGGSSAIYGSDAIAGVVNFVLKRDYEGVQLRGQAGISRHGDGGQYYLSALAGQNFAGGRGNVAANFEYSKQDAVYFSERPRTRNLAYYFQVDEDDPGSPNGSDGVPDRMLVEDLRYLGFSLPGQYIAFVLGPDGNVPAYNFQPDGTLALQTGDRVGFAPFAFYSGGNGSNLNEGKQLGLFPDVKRYAVNLIGHFTVSPAFEPFIEAKFVRTDALGTSLGPFPSVGFYGPREAYFTDNPFLTDQARNLIRGLEGLAPGEEAPFYFGRVFNELGPTQEHSKRDTFRAVGGIRGDFNDDWHYEASVNLAQVKSRSTLLNNVNIQRYLLAIDAVRDASGNIVCRSQIDPSAAIAYEGAANPGFAAAQLGNDVAQCVPLNPFGEGNISQAARDYVIAGNSNFTQKLNQRVLNAFVSGDSSDWFELPGGPIGFAIGGEYRRETYHDAENALLKSGITYYTGFDDFDPRPFAVKELFGEIRLPILTDRPGFERLTIDAAARVADYKGGTGTVVAWNAGGEWAPIRDLRFRVNRSRAIRAPNVSESQLPLSQSNQGGLTVDPCSAEAIGSGSSNRVTNCRAAGVPEGFRIFYSTGFPYLEGGNPGLHEEQSDSLTIGGILQPGFLPGLSLSADYYDIKVSDVIASVGVQEILNRCYDSPDLDNPFCALFQRNAGPGAGPNGEAAGQIIENSLHVVPVNYAALKVRGIDLEANYRRSVPGLGNVSTRLIYTLALQNDSFLNPEDPEFKDQNLLELGNPRHKVNWNLDLKRGQVTLGYQMRYIGKMAPGQIENIRSVQGRPPQDEDAYDLRYLDGVFYHDVRVGVDVGQRYNFYAGVDNLTDRLAPLGVSPIVQTGGVYDAMGRFFYVGAVARF